MLTAKVVKTERNLYKVSNWLRPDWDTGLYRLLQTGQER